MIVIVINGIEYRVVNIGASTCCISDCKTFDRDVSQCTKLMLSWDLLHNNIVPPLRMMPNVNTVFIDVGRKCDRDFAERLINYYINCLADLGLMVEMRVFGGKNVMITDVFQLQEFLFTITTERD